MIYGGEKFVSKNVSKSMMKKTSKCSYMQIETGVDRALMSIEDELSKILILFADKSIDKFTNIFY